LLFLRPPHHRLQQQQQQRWSLVSAISPVDSVTELSIARRIETI